MDDNGLFLASGVEMKKPMVDTKSTERARKHYGSTGLRYAIRSLPVKPPECY